MKRYCCFILFASCMAALGSELYKDPAATPEQRAEDLLAQMTLEEKVEQLAGRGIGASEFGDRTAKWFGTAGNERHGIPDLVMGHGITGVRSGRDTEVHSTYMMAPIGVGATWDVELYSRASAAVAKEMVALHQQLNLGTTLNIIRHPLGGRNWESFSEDPYLTARLGVAHVKAMQANGVISGPKHFVANNQEKNRFDINNEVDERTLREIYLPAFKAAVVEGGALNIMGAYNRVNGTFMCEHPWLLTDVLRKEWGFKGFVLSDFSAGMHSTVPAATSGMNVEMHSPKFYGKKMIQAVQDGTLDEAVVDQLLREKLYVMFKMGVFDDTWRQPQRVVHCESHQALALEVARKSPILLKNKDAALPLDRTQIKRMAVIGPNAKRIDPKSYYFLQGGGSGRTYHFPGAVIDPVAAIQAQAGTADVRYAQGCTPPKRKMKKEELDKDAALIKEAVALAKDSDTVILMVGLSGDVESEGRDRKHAFLPDNQPELVKQVLAANPNTIVVIASGSYVDVSDWIDDAKALLFCFYNGEKLGQAMAEVLFGEVCPGGKLPISYPKSVDQYPEGSIFTGSGYSKKKISNVYSEGIFVGYRYFDAHAVEPLFPFGFGLSYTSFGYSDLKIKQGDQVEVTVTVKNTGSVAGDEIIQLYVHDQEACVPRPVRELKGFRRVSLQPGESQEIGFTLHRDAFSFWNPATKNWMLEPGDFEIQIGASSRDIRASKALSIGTDN